MALSEWLGGLDGNASGSVRCAGPLGGAVLPEHGEPITACICSGVDGAGDTPRALVAGPFGLTGVWSIIAIRVLFVASAGAAARLGEWPIAIALALVVWWEAAKVLRHPAFGSARGFLVTMLVVTMFFFIKSDSNSGSDWGWSRLPLLFSCCAFGAAFTSLGLASRDGRGRLLQVLPAWAAILAVVVWWRPGLVLLLASSAIATRALLAAGLAVVGPVSQSRFGIGAPPALATPRRRRGSGVMAILMPLADQTARLATELASRLLRVVWQLFRGGLWILNQAAWAMEVLALKSRVFVGDARQTILRSCEAVWEGCRVLVRRLLPMLLAGSFLGWMCVWTSRRIHAYLVQSPDASFLKVCAGAFLTVLVSAVAIGIVARLNFDLVARGLRDLWDLDLTLYLLALWITSIMLSVALPSINQSRLALPSLLSAPFFWLMTTGVVVAVVYWRQADSGQAAAPSDPRAEFPVSEPAAHPLWPGVAAAILFGAALWAPRLSTLPRDPIDVITEPTPVAVGRQTMMEPPAELVGPSPPAARRSLREPSGDWTTKSGFHWSLPTGWTQTITPRQGYMHYAVVRSTAEIVVDVEPTAGDPEGKARGFDAAFRRNPTYRLVSIQPAVLQGQTGTEWLFDIEEHWSQSDPTRTPVRKRIVYFNANGRSYGVMFRAPSSAWSARRSDFEAAEAGMSFQ